MLRDSSCANAASTVNRSSDSMRSVWMRSFSNRSVTPSAVSWRTSPRQSDVLRENREMDFVTMRSILPARQSAMRR